MIFSLIKIARSRFFTYCFLFKYLKLYFLSDYCLQNPSWALEEPRDYLKDCIYLEDSFVNLYGLKIYGAPW